MNDIRDDELRRALEAEAEGVEAGPDLLARIAASAASSPATTAVRRRLPLTLAAAAVAVIALVAAGIAVAGRDDGDQTLDVLDEPEGGSSTSTTTTPDASTTTVVSSVVGPVGGPGEPPDLVVYVRADGWLVTRTLSTGVEREIRTEGDPRAHQEGGAYSIDGVDLSPDGTWIYYSTCCEPAVGQTFRVPVGGGARETIGAGYAPSVSPDGSVVALAGGDRIWIHSTRSPSIEAVALDLAEGFDVVRSLTWSPDGTRLAFVDGGGQGAPGVLRTLAWDGTSLRSDELSVGAPAASFVVWDPNGMPRAIVGEPIDDDRVLVASADRWHHLRIDEDGRASYSVANGEEPPEDDLLDDLPDGIIAADW